MGRKRASITQLGVQNDEPSAEERNIIEILNIKERPDLIAQVAQWIHQEWGHFRDRSLQDIVRAIENGCVAEYPFTLVAIMGAEPVGTASLKIHDMDLLQDFTPWLAGVYVPTIHRGKNIASLLVSEVEERARRLGFAQIYLYTSTGAKLYEKLGWNSIQELEYDGIHVVVMDKMLKP
ncbi:MAG: GNAT family N-acetyltransferase [Spirochaetia bacterium]|nr:GNAT family N-acetyltransferase [Spirochaetia bacterium]